MNDKRQSGEAAQESESSAKSASAKQRKLKLARRSAQRRILSNNPLFDADWYVNRYPDVAASGVDPLDHFIDQGWKEGRDPGPDFNVEDYLKRHPGVAKIGANPLMHYIRTTAPAAEASTPSRIKTKWLEVEYLDVPHEGKQMRFAATGSSSVKRVRSLFTKEPITIAWLDSFKSGETMFDIGANLGMYTIYAAVMRDAKVYSFEPESLNYAELNKNIYLNQLHGKVLAYCLALSDVDKLDRLLLSSFGLGISSHDFEENSWKGDKSFAADWTVRKEDRLEQGCVGRKLDSLMAEGLPVPDHIKIDVDGLEHRLIDGMVETLKRPEIRTVLVEINFENPRNLEAVEKIVSLGWRFSWEQLRTHRKVRFTVDQIRTFQKEQRGGLNYIFYKEDFYDDYFRNIFETYTPGVPIDTKRLLNRS